jgi:hypothetical protein
MGKTFTALAVVAFAVILGSYAFLRVSSRVASPVVTPSLSSTPDPYAGWKSYENSDLGFSFRYPSAWGEVSAPAHKGGVSGYSFSGRFSLPGVFMFMLVTAGWSNGTGGPVFGYYTGASAPYAFHYPDGSLGADIVPTATIGTVNSGPALVVDGDAGMQLDNTLRGQIPPPNAFTYAFINLDLSYASSQVKGIEFALSNPQATDNANLRKVLASFKVR